MYRIGRIKPDLISSMKSPQCVDLLDVKPGFEPQGRHQNKIQSRAFREKGLRVIKTAMKSFSKERPRHLCVKLTHTTIINNPD